MKPGPATSTFSTRGSARSLAAIASANSRGLRPASLASTIAALVAMSPCAASRGGSTTTRAWSIPAGSTPSAINASLAARTLSSTTAKMFLGCSVMTTMLLGKRRLTQFRGRVKKPGVLDQGVAVRHAGDEIGDAAHAAAAIMGVDVLRPFRRQVGRLLHIVAEQIADHVLGLRHDAHDARVPIHARTEETLDGAIGLSHRCRKRPDRGV